MRHLTVSLRHEKQNVKKTTHKIKIICFFFDNKFLTTSLKHLKQYEAKLFEQTP